MPIADSQGVTFTFDEDTYECKSIKIKRSASTIDATTLSVATGSQRVLQTAPIVDGDVVTIEFFGSAAPSAGQSGGLSTSLGVSGNAVCEESEITAQVGELIMGTATFRMSG